MPVNCWKGHQSCGRHIDIPQTHVPVRSAFDLQRVLYNSYRFMNGLAFAHVIRPLRLHSIRPENAARKLKGKKHGFAKNSGGDSLKELENLSSFDKAE